jgi:signal peptidase I
MKLQKSTVRLVVEPIAIAIVLAMVARSTFRMYTIPSASMSPTLQIGDHIVVMPYRSPFLADRPERGDVIVFRSPLDPDELLVKRVVAVPGDLVDSRGGRVRIGERTLAEPYVTNPAASGAISAQIIPGESYFVMGDNRGNSFDSRNWGTLPRDLVVGRVRMILWSSGDGSSGPSAHASTVLHPILAPAGALRLDRLFRGIGKAAPVN